MSKGKKSISAALLIAFCSFFVFTLLMNVMKLKAPAQSDRWYVNEKENKADIIDFFQYYQASQLARSDKSVHVYDAKTQRQWQAELISPVPLEKTFYNQQPPSSYTLLYPLSFLKANIAYIFWCIAQVAFGLFGLYKLSSLGMLKKKERFFLLAGTFSCFPAYALIWHGNTTFFLLGFLSLFIYYLYKQRDLFAGICLSLATFKPQYLFPFLVLPLALKRKSVFFGFVIMEVLLLSAAGLIIGFDNVINYPYIVTHAESASEFVGVNAHKMISLRGPIAMFLDPAISLKATAAIMFLILVPLFAVWKKMSNRLSVDGLRWLWSMTICTMVLVSPHSHVFDFLLLSMAAALTLPAVSLLKLNELNSCSLNAKLWAWLFILFPPLSWLFNFTLGHEVAGVMFFFPYVFALFVLSVLNFRKSLSDAKE